MRDRRFATTLGVLLRSAIACLLPCGFTTWADAHPISVTDAYVHVSRERANVQIAVFLEDLYLFHNLAPNDRDFLELKSIRKGAKLHRDFLMNRFVVRDAEGERIPAEFVKVIEPELPAEGVPLAELMMHRLTYEFRYTLTQPPEFLTISQHLVDDEIAIPAEMRLIVKQASSGVGFTSALTSEEPQTVRFDWTGPPLSEEATEAELVKWLEEQKQQTLGITSYSSVYSFLYIEDHEVRHEILMPLLTLAESLPVERRDEAFLEVDEQDALRDAIEAYFVDGNPIVVDGNKIRPSVARLDFVAVDFKDLAQAAARKRVSMNSGRVGVILSYPVASPPKRLELTWDRFNRFIYTIQMIIFAEGGVQKQTLTKIASANTYSWSRTKPVKAVAKPQSIRVTILPRAVWSIPLISLALLVVAVVQSLLIRRPRWLAFAFLLAAAAAWPLARWSTPSPMEPAPKLANQEAQRIVERLLFNTYSAFRLRNEEATYGALSTSVDGELLESLYLKIRRGMLLEQQGGAIATVRELSAITGENRGFDPSLSDERGFRFQLAWTVEGDVEHWGHIHSRTNRYEAVFAVEPREEAWRFTDMEILEESRVDAGAKLRRSF